MTAKNAAPEKKAPAKKAAKPKVSAELAIAADAMMRVPSQRVDGPGTSLALRANMPMRVGSAPSVNLVPPGGGTAVAVTSLKDFYAKIYTLGYTVQSGDVHSNYLILSGATPVSDPNAVLRLSDITNSQSAARVELGAAFDTRDLPAHAGSRTRRFDPSRSLYNAHAANLRRGRAGLGEARAGTGVPRIALLGDSLTMGYNATLGTNDPTGMLRSYLASAGFTADELPHPFHAVPGVDPRVTTSFSLTASVNFPWIGSGAVGATYQISGTGTVFEVIFADNAGGFTIAIDGGAPVTVTPVGNAFPVAHTVTGLSDGEHTAVITASTAAVYLYAAGFRHDTGVVLENAGLYNTMTSDWLNTDAGNFSPLLSAVWLNPDVVFLGLGVNDWKNGVPVATFRTNLTSTVDQMRTHAGTVVLHASNYPSGADATWAPYVSAIYDVADSEDVPLVDLADSFGSYSVYNADGQPYDEASDTAHLTPAGYAHMSRALANVLLS